MLTSLSLIFLVGLAMGAHLQQIKAASHHRDAGNGYHPWALCT